VLLRAHPDVAVAPLAEFAELAYFRVIVLLVILDGKTGGVVNAYVAAEPEENARGFVGEELGVRSLPLLVPSTAKLRRNAHLVLRLPYKTRILSLSFPCASSSASTILATVASSSSAIQSESEVSSSSKNGRYFSRTDASSSL
jgi:hypothetical protein